MEKLRDWRLIKRAAEDVAALEEHLDPGKDAWFDAGGNWRSPAWVFARRLLDQWPLGSDPEKVLAWVERHVERHRGLRRLTRLLCGRIDAEDLLDRLPEAWESLRAAPEPWETAWAQAQKIGAR